jgi:hypothetical protein
MRGIDRDAGCHRLHALEDRFQEHRRRHVDRTDGGRSPRAIGSPFIIAALDGGL